MIAIGRSRFGFLDLLAGGGDRVEPDVGEEDQRGGGHRPAEALALDEERAEVVRVEGGDAEHEEERQHGELEEDHDGVHAGGLAHADHQHGADGEHEEHRRQVEHAAVLTGRVGERLRQLVAEDRVEQLVQIRAPADRHAGDRDAVLEDQVPADDPGRELAERRVGVGVGAARDRDRRGELRERERGEDAGDAREHEGEDDRRAGGRDRLADDHEDAGADDRAEAERGQVEGADGALELRVLVLGVLDEDVDRLGGEEALAGLVLRGCGHRALPSYYDGEMTRTGRRARWISSTGTLPRTLRATRPFVEAPQTIRSASFSSA